MVFSARRKNLRESQPIRVDHSHLQPFKFTTSTMSDLGDEADSRTAAVGAQRGRRKAAARSSQNTNTRPTKRQRRNEPAAFRALEDFVPRGASFSEKPLEVDPDETSSSGSDSESEGDSDHSEASSKPATANPHAGSTAPSVSWNQGRKNAVRTTLGKRKTQPEPEATSAQFKAVNGTYWRSRSGSASSAGSITAKKEDGQSKEDSASEEGEINSVSDSDDSESLDSEADDSIMLNIGTKHEQAADEYDPESLDLSQGLANGHTNGTSKAKGADSLLDINPSAAQSKEEAFQHFSRKYSTAPVTLVDLNKTDLEKQAMFLYWDRDIHTLDLQLPVGCIECFRQGHMAEVCPTKEVVILNP
jgi:protein AIR1/2